MAHTLEIYANVTGRHPVAVQFFGVKVEGPVFVNEKVSISIQQYSSYEPDIQPIIGNPINTFKNALEVANIDASSICCVHVKNTSSSEWKDENIEVEKSNNSPVYVIHFSGAVDELQKLLAIQKIKEIEKSRGEKRRRFAILVYDDSKVPFDRENFVGEWELIKSVVTLEEKQAFNQFEICKLGEYIAKAEEAMEQQTKRQRFFKSLKWLLAPTLWLHLIVLFTTVGCVVAGIDSILTEPFLFSAVAPILMGGVYGMLHLFVAAAIFGLPALLILDYINCRDRVSPYRSDYNVLSYLADIPTRLSNWHQDCPYQVAPFYIGLAGSILLAILVASGIDLSPVLSFISHVIETGFHGLGFISAPGMEAIAAANLQIFTTVLFTLMPLTLGSMAMHVARTFEEGILPSRGKEIAEVNVISKVEHEDECDFRLAVRFRDGLSTDYTLDNYSKDFVIHWESNRLYRKVFCHGKDEEKVVETATDLHNRVTESAVSFEKFKANIV